VRCAPIRSNYIVKPFNAQTLKSKIETVLAKTNKAAPA
jgi:DNA-binding response OmpR family regulator